MSMWAITPNGVGKQVSARRIREDWPLKEGEAFTIDGEIDVRVMVLAEDGISLREGTEAELAPVDHRDKEIADLKARLAKLEAKR